MASLLLFLSGSPGAGGRGPPAGLRGGPGASCLGLGDPRGRVSLQGQKCPQASEGTMKGIQFVVYVFLQATALLTPHE